MGSAAGTVKKPPSKVQVLSDFARWTSASGLAHIPNSRNVFLRVFWLVIVLGCLAGCVHFLWQVYGQYSEHEVVVTQRLSTEGKPFPAVGICHMNPYKLTKVAGNPLGEMAREYNDTLTKGASTTNVYGFSSVSDKKPIQQLADKKTAYVAAGQSQQALQAISYNINDLVKHAYFAGQPLNLTADFIPFPDPHYGMCYIFNYQAENARTSSRPGPGSGLQLMFEIDQTDYLPWIPQPGIKITIEDQETPHFFETYGYSVGVGFKSSLSITYSKSIRLPAPYRSNCTEDAPTWYEGAYTVEACWRTTLQKEIIAKCNCSSPKYRAPPDQNVTVCTQDQITCVDSVIIDLQSSCQSACTMSTYAVDMANALWIPKINYTCRASDPTDEKACQNWMTNNTMWVDIYYSSLNYDINEENAAYGLVNFMSDIGGQSGMWLGFSVITVVEFLYFFVWACTDCIGRKCHRG